MCYGPALNCNIVQGKSSKVAKQSLSFLIRLENSSDRKSLKSGGPWGPTDVQGLIAHARATLLLEECWGAKFPKQR